MYTKGKLIPEINGSIFKRYGRHKRHQSPDFNKTMKGKNRVENEEPLRKHSYGYKLQRHVVDI